MQSRQARTHPRLRNLLGRRRRCSCPHRQTSNGCASLHPLSKRKLRTGSNSAVVLPSGSWRLDATPTADKSTMSDRRGALGAGEHGDSAAGRRATWRPPDSSRPARADGSRRGIGAHRSLQGAPSQCIMQHELVGHRCCIVAGPPSSRRHGTWRVSRGQAWAPTERRAAPDHVRAPYQCSDDQSERFSGAI